eukprot:14879087-Alexandrium_andersonii.AAC.1
MAAIWRVMAWSLNALLSGHTPRASLDGEPLATGGQPLAGGWKAATVQVRGDWEFYCDTFGFPRWSENQEMCWLCRASNVVPELNWMDARPTAGWRGTLKSQATYLADRQVAGFISNIFLVEGFSMEMVMIDVLHTVDLGVAQHVVANILWEVKDGMGPNIDQKVAALHRQMLAWEKEAKPAAKFRGKFKAEKLRNKGLWPELKAKAAVTKSMARFALYLAERNNSGSTHDQRRLAVAQLLVKFYDLIKQEDMVLSQEATREIAELGGQLVVLYHALFQEATAAEIKGWNMTPKFHLFLHLCELQVPRMGNPRFYWTYPDEDLVGHMIEVAKSCHPKTMAFMALYKFLAQRLGHRTP